MNITTIYHVTTRSEWEKALSTGKYQADSLISEGFIHCSERGQIPGVLDRYFAGQKDLVILKINPTKVGERIVYEGPDGGEAFPHIYGLLLVDAVERVYPLDDISTALFRSGDWEAVSESPDDINNDLRMNPKG
jgi:uncharacterized protein (DUF952 family)